MAWTCWSNLKEQADVCKSLQLNTIQSISDQVLFSHYRPCSMFVLYVIPVVRTPCLWGYSQQWHHCTFFCVLSAVVSSGMGANQDCGGWDRQLCHRAWVLVEVSSLEGVFPLCSVAKFLFGLFVWFWGNVALILNTADARVLLTPTF